MIKIGKTIFDGTPRIAVSFTDKTPASLLKKAYKMKLDIAELRMDLFSSYDSSHILKEIKRFKKFSILATIRSKKEGGKWNLTDKARKALFEKIIPKVDAVDIELSSSSILKPVVKQAHRAKKIVIISYHHFKKTPSQKQLEKILKKARAAGADVVKIATMIQNKKDLKTLGTFLSKHALHHRLLVLGMGEKGVTSRLFFPALGSVMTFAYLDRPTAPGQLDFQTTSRLLKKLYS